MIDKKFEKRNLSKCGLEASDMSEIYKFLDDEIEYLEKEIFGYAYENHKREIEISMSVPGILELGAEL